jgi:hypothetical protein
MHQEQGLLGLLVVINQIKDMQKLQHQTMDQQTAAGHHYLPDLHSTMTGRRTPAQTLTGPAAGPGTNHLCIIIYFQLLAAVTETDTKPSGMTKQEVASTT